MARPILRSAQQGQPEYARPQFVSARAAYPSFLSLQDTLALQAGWAWRGLVDASRFDIVLRMIVGDAEIRGNALKSVLLNGISLLSIFVFNFLLHPLANDEPKKGLHTSFGWLYQILWLAPLVGVSLYLNASWCTIIAKRTYTLAHGRASSSYVGHGTSTSPNAYIAFLNSLATSAYRAVMIGTSVVLSFALGYVPVVGRPAEFAFLCWVDAYYCFEFLWIARGLSLSRRVRHLEERWAYYFAFGLPSAILCMWTSTLASAATFALFFPSYIIMATHARPVPYDPYAPLTAPVTPAAQQQTAIHPSPYVPIRLRVFAPVIFINDSVVRVLSLGTRSRAESGVSVNIEEGEAEEYGMSNIRARRAPVMRQGRRKAD
ncbi:hypothetical protein FA95DRAFT_705703 [Auriscalpium vulgare]|uniref:Uncharacterized protein n=1 Tax=Auriscalpium vulgare TaxID=40419 RepID=A0ACB8S1Q0_9AGAM|nr:hypothetical protein FA95DRAFT_705703 [Auriscalpium vulgare]